MRKMKIEDYGRGTIPKASAALCIQDIMLALSLVLPFLAGVSPMIICEASLLCTLLSSHDSRSRVVSTSLCAKITTHCRLGEGRFVSFPPAGCVVINLFLWTAAPWSYADCLLLFRPPGYQDEDACIGIVDTADESHVGMLDLTWKPSTDISFQVLLTFPRLDFSGLLRGRVHRIIRTFTRRPFLSGSHVPDARRASRVC